MSDEWMDPRIRLADGKRCLDAALLYLSWGWSVLPLCPPDHVGVGKDHGKNCKSWGKAPLLRWLEYQSRRATEDEVKSWWRHWPNANVGIALGAVSGMIGLDIDGPGGEEHLRKLYGPLPPTWEFRTPGSPQSRRILLAVDEDLLSPKFFAKNGRKEEFRLLAKGSQTVAPPSRHPSGVLYVWSSRPPLVPEDEGRPWPPGALS